MWADNETRIDLLGFDFLVDSLEVVLTEPRLLPVTVGVAGDWGSGKSSLMEMARERLEAPEHERRYVCVGFSPWRFEDYEDVKVALMNAIVEALEHRIDEGTPLHERAWGLLQRVKTKARQMGLARAAGGIGAAAAGASPQEAQMAAEAADALAGLGGEPEQRPVRRSFDSVAHFHEEFEQLMEALGDDVRALVVFVDDLDRCLTETIVDTFEAIRLFLHAPKTAYVVGAHQGIITAALDGRFPTPEDEEPLGVKYLEKILQNTVAIPPLSEPEAETYINLLFAELHVDPADFERLLERAREVRRSDQLAVAMNDGIASEVIGELPTELAADFEVAHRIAPTLSQGTRGNPRQLKRFLNRFVLRRRTAARRGLELKPGVLAKLMLLEERQLSEFEQLYVWQVEADGPPPQLAAAERLARGDEVENIPEGVEPWMQRPGVRTWLELAPTLAGELLSPYFTFSRDKLSPAATAATRLPAVLQALLVRLQDSADRRRQAAITEVTALEPADRDRVVAALLAAAEREPESTAMVAACELAAGVPAVSEPFFIGLRALTPRRVPRTLAPRLRLHFGDDARVDALFERWDAEGTPELKRAVAQARRGAGRTGRRG
jgi:KAP family P-loop domain